MRDATDVCLLIKTFICGEACKCRTVVSSRNYNVNFAYMVNSQKILLIFVMSFLWHRTSISMHTLKMNPSSTAASHLWVLWLYGLLFSPETSTQDRYALRSIHVVTHTNLSFLTLTR